MVKKLVSAKDILAEKGYVQHKFDTAGFTDAVVRYFRKHGVEATLTVRPRRFVESPGCYPDCGWFAYTEWTQSFKQSLEKMFEIRSIRKYGDEEDFDIRKHKKECLPYFFDYVKETVKKEPYIVVDEPFCKNAVNMLAIMQGFIVKSRRKNGEKEYIVSLI